MEIDSPSSAPSRVATNPIAWIASQLAVDSDVTPAVWYAS
jgi:hypothetical protein